MPRSAVKEKGIAPSVLSSADLKRMGLTEEYCKSVVAEIGWAKCPQVKLRGMAVTSIMNVTLGFSWEKFSDSEVNGLFLKKSMQNPNTGGGGMTNRNRKSVNSLNSVFLY